MAKQWVKVPVVMQMEALECGAACLTMVLAYHGKWLPLEQVRTACGVSRDGSKAKFILMAARNDGLKADGYRLEPEELRKVPMPCILHWNMNHFVVLCGFRGNDAVINDPARGCVRVPMETLYNSFTGICLCFQKTEAFVPSGRPRSVLQFVRTRLSGTRAAFMLIVLLELMTALVGVINPVFSQVFLDRILSGQNPDWLTAFLAAMVGVGLIEVALLVIRSVNLLKIQGKLAIVANTGFMWHVLRLPMRFFSQRMAGDIAERQGANQDIASTLMDELAPVVLNLLLLLFYLAVMLRYSAVLTAIGLSAILLNLWVMKVMTDKRIDIARVQSRDSGKLYSASVSGIEMIETIKSSGAEDGFFERWAGYQASVNTSTVRYARLNQYLGAVPGLLSQIAETLVLLVGVLLIMQRQFTIGMLMAFQGFLTSFLSPFQSLLEVGQSVQEMRTSMERVEDVMEYPADVEPGEELPDEIGGKLRGNLSMRGIAFGYSPLEKPLIEDFDLELTPGRRVALVGSSGCGKSTVAKLISGLYEPWSGEILYDGKPRSAIPRAVFTGSIAVVDQEITLFEDTIGQNIKLWDQTIEDYEMIMAARDAQIHEEILQRSGGYACPLPEGGKSLSGGQRQRLEIARVLAMDPTLIILDEATSALDAVTEHELVDAITQRDISCVIVAHRLSTIRDCDEIIVMDNGHIVERGTHESLYQNGGLYARLVSNE